MADNKIKIDVEVDDNGTTKKVGLESKKAGENLDNLSKSSRTADRNLKGVGQQSSNSSKNFSKMAQGISGGIVPAYAAFAAQVFALTAAFNFLKDAGNLAALEAGQKAYAGATGVAMKTLANSIVAATDAQLDYRDAASAAAIGIASGLNPDQLKRLGGAAKDVSLVLGRDLTDSFNRLIRGVTKAEPELLDELGIVLRLKPATEKYAAAIGKTAEELTAYERSQAVANEVLTQTEEKYSKILAIVDPTTNAFNKFAKAFNDIVNTIKRGLSSLFGPIAEFLAANPFATLLLSAPLLNGFLKQIIPQFEGLGSAASASLDKLNSKLKETEKSAKIDLASLKFLQGDSAAAAEYVSIVNEELVDLASETETGFRGLKKLQEGGELAGRTISSNLKAATDGTGEFANMAKETRLKYVELFKNLDVAAKASTNKVKGSFNILTAKLKVKFTEIRIKWNQMLSTMVAKTEVFVTKVANAFSKLAMKIAAGMFAIDIGKMILEKMGFSFDTLSKKQMEHLEKLKSLNEEYEDFIKIHKVLNEGLNDTEDSTLKVNRVLLQTAVALGQVSKATSVQEEQTMLSGMIENLQEAFYHTNRFTAAGQQIEEQMERWEMLSDAIKTFGLDFTPVGKEYQLQLDRMRGSLTAFGDADIGEKIFFNIEDFLKAKVNFEALTSAMEEFQRISKDLPQELSGAFDSLVPKTPYDKIIRSLETQKKLADEIRAQEVGTKLISENEESRLKINEELLVLFKQEQERLNAQAVAISKLGSLEAKLSKNATKLQQERNQAFIETVRLKQSEANVDSQINHLIQTRIREGKALQGEDLAVLAALEAQKDVLKEQIALIKLQQQDAYKLGMAFKQGLEDGLQTNIYDLIIGNESSFKDAVLKTAEAALQSVAKMLSTIITEKIMNAFGMETDEQRQRRLFSEVFKSGAADMETAIKNGGTKLGQDIEAALQKYKASVETGIQARQGQTLSELPEDVDTSKVIYQGNVLVSKPSPVTDESQPSSTVSPLTEEGVRALKSIEMMIDTTHTGNSIRVTPQTVTEGQSGTVPFVPIIGQTPTGPTLEGKVAKVQSVAAVEQNSAAGEQIAAAEAQKENTGVFGSAIAKFGQDSNTLLAGLSSMLVTGGASAASVAATVLSAGVSAFFGSLGGPAPTARTGGILSEGSKVAGYSSGGVAKGSSAGYPAILHGTEAVVPLPNGKSIPVDMKGAGQQNNVVVNVSVDNQGNGQTNTDSQSGADAGLLGQAIAKAVQQELQNQKRSGGILNPYGVA